MVLRALEGIVRYSGARRRRPGFSGRIGLRCGDMTHAADEGI